MIERNNTVDFVVTGGYYMIERKTLKLQIVVLNTNLMRRDDSDDDANRQWDWLNKVLHKCQLHKETVLILFEFPGGYLILSTVNRCGQLIDQKTENLGETRIRSKKLLDEDARKN
ncbi:hypothetical protein FQA39_LY02808 [Lamprigera yunnana]|nr:hypothetical protein FQA39_LY02808 [Lamprigera yunnana]